MELLVVTLGYTQSDRDTEGLARIRLISDTIRNAPGLVNARFYRNAESVGRRPEGYPLSATPAGFPQTPFRRQDERHNEHETYYFLLTTWEDEDCWQKAQERYNPKHLLLETTNEVLSAEPEQWLMNYLWGYSRPTASPVLAAAHLATVQIEHAERLQRGWIESLRRQALQPTMAFAFLAQSIHVDLDGTALQQHSLTFLNLLSWSSEAAREEFYADQNYKAVSRYLSSIGFDQVLTLEPLTSEM